MRERTHPVPDDVRLRDVENILRSLSPAGVQVSCRLSPSTDLAVDAERKISEAMVPRRRDEFLTGRTCARECIRALGLPDSSIGKARDRRPIWPETVVGSIAHTADICAAAVGLRSDFISIGIDLEQCSDVGEELAEIIATPEEQDRFTHVSESLARLFSIKEATYKCLNPPTGIWLDFHDVNVVDLSPSRFRARVSLRGGSKIEIRGRHDHFDDIILAAVVLDRDAAAQIRTVLDSAEEEKGF